MRNRLAIASCEVLLALLSTVVTACGSCHDRSEPLAELYRHAPSYESAVQGDFATGAVFADINGDGRPDLVVANGNDMSPQPLVVYLNHCDAEHPTCFLPYPDYYSDDIDYQGKLSIGDIDHDGWPDVAVSVPFDRSRNTRGGGIKIYRNLGGRLEPTPSQRIGHFGVLDCALADVNADGWLDLVVPAFATTSTVDDGVPLPEPARIYLNVGGQISARPSWESQDKMIGTGVTVADINQDGWMDVAIAGGQTYVYPGGSPTLPGMVPIAPVASWKSASDGPPALAVDAGHIGDVPALTLAVSRWCYPGTVCPSDFALYRMDAGDEPIWKSEPTEQSSQLLLADLNADGLLDMIAGQWGPDASGAPLWFFQGQPDGRFHRRPDFVTTSNIAPPVVAESLAAADTRRCRPRSHVFEHVATAAGAVITLPVRQIEAVLSIEVAGRPSPGEWTSGVGANWVSLAQSYAPGEVVRVRYRSSDVLDIAEATWSPQRGNRLYNSFLDADHCD